MGLTNGFLEIGNFISQNYLVLLFYVAIVYIVIKNKHKFDIQLGFIALYRTKYGLKAMDKWSHKFPRFFKFIGYLGIVFGFIGMVFIFYYLTKGVYNFFVDMYAPATVGLVIPGIKVANSPFNSLDIFSAILIIFIVATIHEFGHGVISRVHEIKVKSSGIVFFGPLIGAFVEPDNKQLFSSSNKAQLSMFAAGPFFNLLLTLLAVGLISILPFAGLTYGQNQPLIIDQVIPDSSLSFTGIGPGETILEMNDKSVNNLVQLKELLSTSSVNDSLKIKTDKGLYINQLRGHPLDNSVPFLGIKPKTTLTSWFFMKFELFLFFLAAISFGIGIANLLPLGPLDGGRMIHNVINQIFKGKFAIKLFVWISIFTLVLLGINIFWPILRLFF